MNNNRRKIISSIIGDIEVLLNRIETIRDDEQETYESMPESFQNSERGEASQNAIDQLEEAISNLESTRDALDNAKE